MGADELGSAIPMKAFYEKFISILFTLGG